jgi:hypothetical protein
VVTNQIANGLRSILIANSGDTEVEGGQQIFFE